MAAIVWFHVMEVVMVALPRCLPPPHNVKQDSDNLKS